MPPKAKRKASTANQDEKKVFPIFLKAKKNKNGESSSWEVRDRGAGSACDEALDDVGLRMDVEVNEDVEAIDRALETSKVPVVAVEKNLSLSNTSDTCDIVETERATSNEAESHDLQSEVEADSSSVDNNRQATFSYFHDNEDYSETESDGDVNHNSVYGSTSGAAKSIPKGKGVKATTIASALTTKKYNNLFRVKSEGSTIVQCIVCQPFSDIQCKNKGVGALDFHMKTRKHENAVRNSLISKKVDTMIPSIHLEKKICAFELTLAFHTVKHHHSFRSSECTVKLNKKILNECEAGAGDSISCGRTKLEAIVTGVLAEFSIEKHLDRLKNPSIKFSVGTDGSNHKAEKMFPTVLQYFNKEEGIVSFVLDFASLKNETSETITNNVLENIKTRGIEKGCIAFSADNTNTNFGGLNQGGRNNVYHHLKENLGIDLFAVGCPAHIVNNCAHFGITALKLNISSIILQIHDYFKSFTVRTEELKGFCLFCQTDYQPTLFFSPTRWLTMFPAVERILKLYPALKSYFNSVDPSKSSRDLVNFFSKPVNEAILLFVHSLMALFHPLICSLEKENHSILDSLKILTGLEDKLLTRKVTFFLPLQVSTTITTILIKYYVFALTFS